MQYIRFLNSLSVKDNPAYGSKASFLGEMLKAGFKVPPGFAINLKAFEVIMKISGAKKSLKTKDPSFIREAILKTEIPVKITKEIIEDCKKLGLDRAAVRSSSRFEDRIDRAAAGQFDSFLNVPPENLFLAVKKVWASAYGEKAVTYAKRNGIGITDLNVAVVV